MVFQITVDVIKDRSTLTQNFYMENEASVTWGENTEITNRVETQLTPDAFTLKLIKQDIDDTNIKLNGVKFELTHPDGTTTPHTTTGTQSNKEKGEIDFGELKVGKYVLKEVKTVSGYQLISSPYTFEVNSNGTVSHDPNSVTWQYSINNRSIILTANNKLKPKLPFTGGEGSKLLLKIILLFLIVAAILFGRLFRNYRLSK